MSAPADAPGLLFLGGASPLGSSIDVGRLLLTQAGARGFRTHLTNTAEGLAATPEVVGLADAVSTVNPDDVRECARWARAQRAVDVRFDVVLGMRDTVLRAAAESAAVFGAAGLSPLAVADVRLKDRCRAVLAAAGFRQPQVRLCEDTGQAIEFLASTTGPWVVKPRDGMASIGVRKVAGAEDLSAAVEELPVPGPFLIGEFVRGQEFSVEGVFLDSTPRVLAVTSKEKTPPPYFVEVGHLLPADLPEAVREDIELTVGAALVALGLRFGVFHAELWITDAGVVLGEVHPRPGGDWLHLLLAHAIPGLELFGLILDDVLGRLPSHDLRPTRGAAVRFLTPGPGKLVRVEGWDALLAHPSVLRAELLVEPGVELGPVRQSADRAGAVVVGADTPAQAQALAAELAASVEFVVR